MAQPIHASAVGFDGAGLIVMGPSGSGKSTLVWQLIGLGGVLVADDRVHVVPTGDRLWLDAPEAIRGKIEARQFGLLTVDWKPAFAKAVVDLSKMEAARLPEPRHTILEGIRLPLFYKVESSAFPAMLRAYLWQKGTDGPG